MGNGQTAPDNPNHGYHLTQYMAPWIPLSKADAITLYKLSEDKSIEWKLLHYPKADFIRHVMAGFVEGIEKPFSQKMLLQLCDKNLEFVKSSEVNHDLGLVYLGVDWGGGDHTVVWIWQCLDSTIPLFRLLHVEKIHTSNVHEQYNTVSELIDSYKTHQVMVDSGGGTHQLQSLENRYGPRCVKLNYTIRPGEPLPNDTEMRKLRSENRFQVDKSFAFETIKDLIGRSYTTGIYDNPRIILPAKDFKKIEWIIEQFTNEEAEITKIKDKDYLRYYRPEGKRDDCIHACIYAYYAWQINHTKELYWKSFR